MVHNANFAYNNLQVSIVPHNFFNQQIVNLHRFELWVLCEDELKDLKVNQLLPERRLSLAPSGNTSEQLHNRAVV